MVIECWRNIGMNKIKVVGLGPGHKDYILPKGMEAINNSNIVIGAKRNLQAMNLQGKESYEITGNLDGAIDFIKNKYIDNRVAVIVSGDTGFYSLLTFLKKHFTAEELEVIPGISSMQYMFARLGESWENAYLGSLHGRDNSFAEGVREHKKVCLLTDKKWTPFMIAQRLIEEGVKDRVMYIGENLSYENERITRVDINKIDRDTVYDICVVVIVYE